MNYDSIILRILKEAGNRGLSVKKITMHVFNASNSLFSQADFDNIHRYVSAFLRRNSKKKNPIITKTGTRGHYRLNPEALQEQQLEIDFDAAFSNSAYPEREKQETPSLFD